MAIGKLHSKYKDDTLLATRNNLRMEFPAANFDRAYSFNDDFITLATDDTTGDPTEYTMNVVEAGAGNSTATLADAVGGVLRLTSAANENDGVQLQTKSEPFMLADDKPLWYGVRVKFPKATQFDGAFGLCITTTTVTDGVTDGVFFRTADGDAALDFIVEKDSTETSTEAITTITTNTWYTLEFEFDGTNVEAFVDGTSIGAAAATNIPDNEELAVTFAATNGESGAVNTDVDWVRVTQLR